MKKADLKAENARLRGFARAVIKHYEWDPTAHQCDWCLWMPGRDWDPVHDCWLVEISALLSEEKP